ncbi:TetR/AcrR family transcriptional regulator [Desulfoferrobacter suflitae]|uniref:TetR/AcrR family transcriptional regulator n=1 Tax=Desulfoferrobacter suflitae TaxID=2865782 RepID=UPI0021643D91|nr:TetR/AcrR family transcriptional regulator [Desulfoferrobacter suflitae]MCK8602785.1 TetR family transcriptional regulator [Desulfoferrobacter suflitae]
MRNKSAEKYQRILDAAVKVFAQKGFFQSKVSEIAKEAGVADGTIYLYFKNKDDLLISIFEIKMQEVIAHFRAALNQQGDAVAKLKHLIHMHLEEFQANPDLAAVFQVELRQSSRFMHESEKMELKLYLDLIGEIVEQGQREHLFRDELPVGLIKRFIFGTLDEIVSTWVLAGRRYDLRAQADLVVDLLLRGVQRDCEVRGQGNQQQEVVQ